VCTWLAACRPRDPSRACRAPSSAQVPLPRGANDCHRPAISQMDEFEHLGKHDNPHKTHFVGCKRPPAVLWKRARDLVMPDYVQIKVAGLMSNFWGSVADPVAREELKQRMDSEAMGSAASAGEAAGAATRRRLNAMRGQKSRSHSLDMPPCLSQPSQPSLRRPHIPSSTSSSSTGEGASASPIERITAVTARAGAPTPVPAQLATPVARGAFRPAQGRPRSVARTPSQPGLSPAHVSGSAGALPPDEVVDWEATHKQLMDSASGVPVRLADLGRGTSTRRRPDAIWDGHAL
jgi:hypothetical protein